MFNSPLPSPSIFDEPTFSTKKEIRNLHIRRDTPRPPPKSAPTQSRCFPHRYIATHPQLVTFKSDPDHDHSFFKSKKYDVRSKELYFDQLFDVDYKIGTGSFGEVYRVRSRADGKYYAVKKALEPFRSMTDRTKKLEEVQKHELLPFHPNLVKYLTAWEERCYLYIQTELCQASLLDFSEKYSDIPEIQLWFILMDLLQAVAHLHSHNMVHLDIKPANVFVSQDGICKLGDFGLVLDLTKNNRSSEEGDAKYMAPETLEGFFSPAADIFSLGLTILELATDLDVPKSGDCWHLLRSGKFAVPLGLLLQRRSQALVSIICSMMAPDPRDRPTASDLLRDPQLIRHTRYRKYYYIRAEIMDFFRSVFTTLCFYLMVIFNFLLHPFHGLESHGRPRSSHTDGFDRAAWFRHHDESPQYPTGNGFMTKQPVHSGMYSRGAAAPSRLDNGRHPMAQPAAGGHQPADPTAQLAAGGNGVNLHHRWMRSNKNGVYGTGGKNVSFDHDPQPYSYAGRGHRGNLSFMDSSFSDDEVSDISSIHNSTGLVPPDPTSTPLVDRSQDASFRMSPSVSANAWQRPWKSTPNQKLPARANAPSRWYDADEQESPMVLSKAKTRARVARKPDQNSFLRRLDEYDDSPVRDEDLTGASSADEDEEHARLYINIPPKKLLEEFEDTSSDSEAA